MKGYDVVVRFFVEASDEDEACGMVEGALYRSSVGGFGYEIIKAFESEDDRD